MVNMMTLNYATKASSLEAFTSTEVELWVGLNDVMKAFFEASTTSLIEFKDEIKEIIRDELEMQRRLPPT